MRRDGVSSTRKWPVDSNCSSRAPREIQSDSQQRQAARVRALRRRHQNLEDHANIAEIIRISAHPTCDIDANLVYVTATEIDV
jgi:hypothetical protein